MWKWYLFMIGVGFKYTPPPMAIKVHTGKFIRKMTIDMKDVPVTCSNSDTSAALTMIRYSLPLATRFLHVWWPSDTSTALTMIRYSLPLATVIQVQRLQWQDIPCPWLHVTSSNSDTSTALTMIRYSLPLATRFLHVWCPLISYATWLYYEKI